MRNTFCRSFVLAVMFCVAFNVSEALVVEKIFFHSTRSSGGDPAVTHIWMMNPDGTGVEQVTFGNVSDRRPLISPDGQRVGNRWTTSTGSQGRQSV